MSKVKTQTLSPVKESSPPVAELKPPAPRKTLERTPAAPQQLSSTGATGRARQMTSMQRAVGNSRLSRMLGSAPGHAAATREQPAGHNGDGGPQMMSVSRPDSPSERQAEAVAQRVVAGQSAPPITPVSSNEIHTAGPAAEAMDTSAAAGAVARKGAGSPVNPELRRSLEPRMGARLDAARVHSDSDANEAAHSINARAFTHGSDIFLARGESERDTHLMAHELTHVVQQSGAPSDAVSRAPQGVKATESKAAPGKTTAGAKPGKEELVATAELELKGKSEFPADEPVGKFLEEHTGKDVTVSTRFGSIAKGPLSIKRDKKGKFHARQQSLPISLSHPLFAGAGEALKGLQPSLIVSIEGSTIKGFVGLAAMSKLPSKNLSAYLAETPELFGLAGFDLPKKFVLTNDIEGGVLHLGLSGVTLTLGSAFSVTLEKFMVEDEKITFAATADVNVKGFAKGSLKLERADDGVIKGKATITIESLKNFSGGVEVAWDGQAITGTGEVAYQGEKLSGKVMLNLMDEREANALAREKKPPEEAGKGAKGGAAESKDKPGKKGEKINYVVFGEGDLTFSFTDWLSGMAHVIVDPEGFVTIIGKITPQKQFELFEVKEFVKPIFKFEARAAYGLPVVGDIFIFGNVGLDAVAKLGPGILKDITVEGKYSTNPAENKDFRVSGVVNISAFAGLRLRAEVGVGLEILAHEIKAGAGINGIVGIQGYAEAKPIIGYREKGEPGQDKKGEFFIRGELEVAAQPFLGLSGDLFVELDTPWWSPLSDDKWTWPLGSKEWPIGGSFGLKASVDYVFGSKEWPSFEFQPVDFDAEKFMTDMYNDKAQPKSGGAGDQKGDWKEKNEAADAAPPTAGPGKTDATPGKAGELPPAKPTVSPGGAKGTKQPVDPNAKTAEGKSVKEYEEEATKKGKENPKDKDLKGSGAQSGGAEKDPAKKEHDEELTKGVAALQHISETFGKKGATKEEVVAAVQSVHSKFKVFKSIEVVDKADRWDINYVANPGTVPGPTKAQIASQAVVDYKAGKITKNELVEKLLGGALDPLIDPAATSAGMPITVKRDMGIEFAEDLADGIRSVINDNRFKVVEEVTLRSTSAFTKKGLPRRATATLPSGKARGRRFDITIIDTVTNDIVGSVEAKLTEEAIDPMQVKTEVDILGTGTGTVIVEGQQIAVPALIGRFTVTKTGKIKL
jgi:hypothetical protein